jgi:hypothetical protein
MGEGQKESTGFLGFSTGIEYYRIENRFLSINASAILNAVAPVPASVSYLGETEFFSSFSLGITENYKFKRFTFGYGLNFSKNNWKFENTEYDANIVGSKEPVYKSNYGIGLVGNSYFRVIENLFVGINYRPFFFNIKPLNNLQYEHVLSFDFTWKVRLK